MSVGPWEDKGGTRQCPDLKVEAEGSHRDTAVPHLDPALNLPLCKRKTFDAVRKHECPLSIGE